MPEIVCLGILVADVIARPVTAHPARGALMLVEEMRPFIGGCAANTGIGLQKLGFETAVVGKVGRDGFGDFVQSELVKHGVDASGVSRHDSVPTAATMVMVAPDAERSFIHCVGANAAFCPDDVPWQLMQEAQLLHVAGHGLMAGFDGASCAHLLQEAHKRGLKTCLDTAGAPDERWIESLRLVLPHLDFFVPSLHEARHLLPQNAQATPERVAAHLLDAGVGVVALKLGERGCYVTDGRDARTLPPFEVEALDATGAGDAFAAGFLAGALRGFDLAACAKLGNAVGALCVTRVGTVDGIRSLPETLDFIEGN